MKYISFTLLVLAIIFMCQQTVEAQLKITNSVFGNGGAVIESKNHRIVGTVGQPMIGVLTSQTSKHFVGFWYVANIISLSAPLAGDVNNDGEILPNDAILALRIAADLMTPTAEQKFAADINGDGEVLPNDAILILREAAGLAAPSIDVVASVGKAFTLMLAETHGVAGESVKVPLKIDHTDGLAGGDIQIAYDSEVLKAVDVSSDAGVSMATNVTEPGIVRITFASAEGLKSKTVAEIQFEILADDVSPLRLQDVKLYQSDALLVDSKKIDGKFISWNIKPEHSALLPNFPNPFNPETWIPYQLREGSEVKIRIYNIAGELVRELDLGHKPAGLYVTKNRAAYWDGKNNLGTLVASGVYFYSIKAGDFSAVRKLVVLK